MLIEYGTGAIVELHFLRPYIKIHQGWNIFIWGWSPTKLDGKNPFIYVNKRDKPSEM